MTNSTMTTALRRYFGLMLAALMLITTTGALAAVEYTYDANGRLTGVYAPSGDAAQYVYDPAGNITQINRFSAAQLNVVDFSPKSGPIGTTVIVYGTGFSSTPANNWNSPRSPDSLLRCAGLKIAAHTLPG